MRVWINNKQLQPELRVQILVNTAACRLYKWSRPRIWWRHVTGNDTNNPVPEGYQSSGTSRQNLLEFCSFALVTTVAAWM